MEPVQRIAEHQTIQMLNNDMYGSADSNSSSSYISSSGIKSVLLNAWNTVKSAISGILSSFGSHLCGQQGSDKPGREITVDMSSRPAQPLPGTEAQPDNIIYECSGENTYDSVYTYAGSGRSESLYASVDNNAFVSEPIAPPVPDSPRPSFSRPSGNKSESEIMDPDEGIYAEPYDTLNAGDAAESEAFNLINESIEDNYAVPQDVLKAGSIPENDPRGEGDYDVPWKSSPGAPLQQRMMSERLKMP